MDVCVEKYKHFLVAELHMKLRQFRDQGLGFEEILEAGKSCVTTEKEVEHIRFWADLYAKSPRNAKNAPSKASF